MIRQKKGQAAMEFLMTYGWAILAALIVVGVLAFMIGRPQNLAPESFTMVAPFTGNAFTVNTTTVEIEIVSGLAESITVTNVDVGCGSITVSQSIAAGGTQAFSIPCAQTQGDRMNEDVKITYTKAGSTLSPVATGTISAGVK